MNDPRKTTTVNVMMMTDGNLLRLICWNKNFDHVCEYGSTFKSYHALSKSVGKG